MFQVRDVIEHTMGEVENLQSFLLHSAAHSEITSLHGLNLNLCKVSTNYKLEYQ